METAVYGLFSDPHAAQGAFEALRDSAAELGLEARHIISISSEPFDEFEFGARESKTPMPWLAALGGLVGAAGGFGLTALTQEAYPLPTGGMPIVAHWTNAIIIYEMAMLGAVLAILLALLAGARPPDLPRSGEGRVGEEGRSRGVADHLKKKKKCSWPAFTLALSSLRTNALQRQPRSTGKKLNDEDYTSL